MTSNANEGSTGGDTTTAGTNGSTTASTEATTSTSSATSSASGDESTGEGATTTGEDPIDVNFFYGYFMLDNYLAEVEGHSNVVLGPSSVEFIEEAKARGMKPIVWLSFQIYPWDVVGDHLALRADYLDIWNAYAEVIAPYADDIYGFYPHDEPFWAAKLSVADQDALNLAIKASFPDKPILTTFARPTIAADDFVVPATYDIVSYDNFYGLSFESDYQYYQELKSKLSPGQKMFLLGDGFAVDDPITPEMQQHKGTKIHQAYELARSPGEPLVGILTFVWNGYTNQWPNPGGTFFPGVREMPIAAEQFIEVGKLALAEQ